MFVWERSTEKVVKLFKADHYTVNCVQPHPSRFLIASSGIESVVRFWEPVSLLCYLVFVLLISIFCG